MSKYFLCALLFVPVVLCSGQQSPPACQPTSYFGVSGCLPSAQGRCPAGYHLQVVNPPNPAMKAPSRQICVADSASSKSALSPEETVEAFYKWYLHSLREKHEPLTDEEPVLSKYVSSALISRIKKQMNNPDGLDADYFLQAQDYQDEWETHVSAAKAMISGITATTTVTLGSKNGAHKLRIILEKQDGVWRIGRVRDAHRNS